MKPSYLLLLVALIFVVQGKMSILSTKSKASMTFVALRFNHRKDEYRTQRAYDCHHRHPNTIETPCADPRNQRSIVFTGRQDQSTRVLQEHVYKQNLLHPVAKKNILIPTLITYLTMFVTFAPVHDRAGKMNSLSLHFITLIQSIHLIQCFALNSA